MAVMSKKEKLIEDAQKLALRGQFEKAAKAYEQILALEPAAINHRQKLAELLIKCGRSDAARKEFETIGTYFSKNGFFLKAIAVYKQLQKLFPADISLSLTLAELNAQLGLIANSLSEYKLVYEFNDKTGNIAEATGILERMQHIDPLNIPIKIKLAETFFKQGNRQESYALFAKTAAMLMERSDSSTLSKINTRVQQLFHDKTDFMLEILSEQINSVNAAPAIGTLQNLLRSNPNDKRVWELTIKAYQQLDQPQRVKIAYQHYLNYFPTEPVAMLGLISSVTSEHNVAGALKLLEKYETAIISGGFLPQLGQIYLSLEKIEPKNALILRGLIRIATSTGNESGALSLSAKLNSLNPAPASEAQNFTAPEPPPVFIDERPHPFDSASINESPAFGEIIPEPPVFYTFENTGPILPTETTSEVSPFTATGESSPQSDEEIEIDIDFDSPFASPDGEIDAASDHDDWLDSANDPFGTVSTAPRRVKFGNDLEISDAQSHFDLGQAFKEMGLYDEAINEFGQASQEPSRRVKCLIMQCACLRERGEVEKAISMLQALIKTGLNIEESCAVKYEMATGFEAVGKIEEANLLLSEINTAHPGFRDISARKNATKVSESLDFTDDDLNNF